MLISGEKKISVVKTADTTYVEITVAEDGEFSQKSASLTLKKWKYLCDNIEAIKLAVKNYISRGREGKYLLHLGKDQFVSVEEGVACVDIRKWYKCPDRERLFPTRNGIALKLDDFNDLMEQLADINADIDGLDSAIPCQYTHAELNETQQCTFCTPSASF